MKQIMIREAQVEDATTIAEVVCMAIGYDHTHPIYPIFRELAAREDTQYSYRNTLIAEVDGAVAGAIIGYDGARLHELRAPIFELMERHFGEVLIIEDETEAGEFYLDSCAIFEQYRGMGIGSRLICAMRERAFAAGHKCAGLIVDKDNPEAERLYRRLGFVCVGERRFLGHDMWHMQYLW